MASLNKCILIGGLTRDPEIRFMPNGEAVVNFSIGTSETWKDKSGFKQERSEYHNIVAYRKLAEIVGEYCKKGTQVYVEGKLATRSWEKDGIKRYSTEIIIDHMQMLGGGKDNRSGGDYVQPDTTPQQNTSGSFEDMGEDIPW
jgi:single-strand DNA-binding protein